MEMRYKSIVTGNEITTWKDRREEFARENLVDVSDMPTTWKDDIGKPPRCHRPITDKHGKPYDERYTSGVGTFARKAGFSAVETDPDR